VSPRDTTEIPASKRRFKLYTPNLPVTKSQYEVHKDCIEYKERPTHPFLRAHWHEIGPFSRKIFHNIARPLLILHAIILELPEDYFLPMHDYDAPSEDFIRWMLNSPRSREEHEITEPYNIGGHADFSSLTLLFEQNVLGLQMLTKDNEWLWVKPVKGGVTVNAGESLQHITKGSSAVNKRLISGYVKATIHRVHAPPEDQLDYQRLGCIYFSNVGVITTFCCRLANFRINIPFALCNRLY
jgi:isopenicillin N synthase-like dioxygenase